MTSLLYEIEKYLRLYKEKPSTFGRRALRDPRFVFNLRAGRSPTERTAAKVREILKHPPSGPPPEAIEVKPGDIWETVEENPRLIQIKGTSAIDPDVWVVSVAGLEKPAWIVKATGMLLLDNREMIQARPIKERQSR